VSQRIFLHFYTIKPLTKFDPFLVAMASTLLGSKVEECAKTLRDIIFIFHHLYNKRKGLESDGISIGGVLYKSWKAALVKMEMILLKDLGFRLYHFTDLPHKYLLPALTELGIQVDGHSLQMAWNCLNDSGKLMISTQYPSSTLVAAAIRMTDERVGWGLSASNDDTFYGVALQAIDEIRQACFASYEDESPAWVEPLFGCKYCPIYKSERMNIS
jgi:hypothetical protein